MKKKKGVSPLLATVLLVAFAIALAAIVSTYVINKAREFDPSSIAQSSVYCDSVSLGYTINDPNLLGFVTKTGGYKFLSGLTLVNRGTFSIQQLIITAPGQGTRTYPIIDKSVTPYKVGKIKPGADNKYPIELQLNTVSRPEVIRIVPVIMDIEKNQLVECTDRQLIFNYQELCQEVTQAPCRSI